MATHNFKSKTVNKQPEYKYVSILESCPPKTPYEIYEGAGTDAVNNEFGDRMDTLNDEMNELILSAADVAVYAALQAAHVRDDWSDHIAPRHHSEVKEHKCDPRMKFSLIGLLALLTIGLVVVGRLMGNYDKNLF